MTSENKVTLEPIGWTLRGAKTDRFLSESFLKALREEFPNVVVDDLVFSFTDSKDIIYVGYPREEGKTNQQRLDVDGNDPALVNRMAELLKRLLS